MKITIGRMRVLVIRNQSPKRWMRAKMPVRQTLIWAGPLFILIQPRPSNA